MRTDRVTCSCRSSDRCRTISSGLRMVLSYEMASENRIGEYQGVFNALQDAGQFASSTVFGFVVGMNNPSGWLMIAVLFFVTGIAFDFIRAHLLIPGTGKAVS